MSLSPADLDRYFDRIDCDGPRTPTHDALAAIHLAHPQAIPFENLDPLLKRPVRLDTAALIAKLVDGRRGGYCFEHNLLLKDVLTTLRFNVKGLAARVLWSRPDVVLPRTHMVLLIDLDGAKHVADVGFGGMTLTAPLRLVCDVAQSTPHGVYRLIESDGAYTVQAQIGGAWRALYRFDMQPQLLPDYQVANWYLCNHPDSPFLDALIAARIEAGRRHVLRDNDYAIHEADGATKRTTLTDASALRQTLEGTFGIALPHSPAVAALLDRFVTTRDGG
ncbi:MAG TPA: arylamine N-acetyltransferase [Casimicrobiaceae bacterium]|nr:arylamine N-acetyltransferase [Casimicrobiaceae bacterium]